MTAAAQAREGWDALALGNWAAARRSFQASLAAGRTPEGWEGLAWACFWLLDVDELLRARAEAYRLYLRRSDVYGAVSAATWRANDVAAALSGNFRELWAIAWSWCFVIYACERVHDYDRAVQWCERSRR